MSLTTKRSSAPPGSGPGWCVPVAWPAWGVERGAGRAGSGLGWFTWRAAASSFFFLALFASSLFFLALFNFRALSLCWRTRLRTLPIVTRCEQHSREAKQEKGEAALTTLQRYLQQGAWLRALGTGAGHPGRRPGIRSSDMMARRLYVDLQPMTFTQEPSEAVASCLPGALLARLFYMSPVTCHLSPGNDWENCHESCLNCTH